MGVAGAAANVPQAAEGGRPNASSSGSASRSDEVRNFEISKTTTHTVKLEPRLSRLSIAVLVDGADGDPRSTEEMGRLSELAKKAVGFDLRRGDQFEISSIPFNQIEEPPPPKPIPFWKREELRYIAVVAVTLMAFIYLMTLQRRRSKKRMDVEEGVNLLTPGAKVAELEATIETPNTPIKTTDDQTETEDPRLLVRERARELTEDNPERVALLIRAWISNDQENEAQRNAG